MTTSSRFRFFLGVATLVAIPLSVSAVGVGVLCCTVNPPRLDPNIVRVAHYCRDVSDEQRAWILACIEKANPHSDETPSGYINACADRSEELFCPRETYIVEDGQVYWCHLTDKCKALEVYP